jgi:hypothetical protein
MATVNFSVPDDVKRAFNATFAGQNKSAVIARLMREAVEEEQRKQRRTEALERLEARKAERPPLSRDELAAAREQVREWP